MEAPTLNRRQFVVGAGATVTGARLGGIQTTTAHSHDNEKPSQPSIIAHRGFAGMYPENTVRAARLAAGLPPREASHHHRKQFRPGAAMIEIDVMATADGDVVVFHDDRLAGRDGGERGLTDRSGIVWETPTETVLAAEVLDSGETIPLLDELVEALPPWIGVNVEFKNPGTSDLRFAKALDEDTLTEQKAIWRPFTENVLSVVSDHENEILVSSFYEAALATVRETDPSIPVAFLFWDSIPEGLTVTRRYDCEAIHPPWNMIKHTPFFGDEYYTSGPFADTDLLKVANNEDRAVNVYTIETWYQATQLANAGVDGLIADYPGLRSINSMYF